MWMSLADMEMATASTPQSSECLTSSMTARFQARMEASSPRPTISPIVAFSSPPMAGMPTSIWWTPTSSRSLAMRIPPRAPAPGDAATVGRACGVRDGRLAMLDGSARLQDTFIVPQAGEGRQGGSAVQRLEEQLVDELRVGGPAGRFHDLPDEEAQHLLLAAAVLLHLRRIVGDHPGDGRLELRRVADLAEAVLLDDLLRLGPLRDHPGEDVLAGARRDRAVGDELHQLGEALGRDVAVAGLEAGGVEMGEVLAHRPVGRRLGAGPQRHDLLVERGQRMRAAQHEGVRARQTVLRREAFHTRRRQLRLRRAQLLHPGRVDDQRHLSLIHISEPTRLGMISYA